MKLCFQLSLRDSNRLYAKVLSFAGKKREAKRRELIGVHYYAFGDGYSVNITIREVDNTEARAIQKKSAGFCGYEWMIDSLLNYGEILGKDARCARAREWLLARRHVGGRG